MNKRLKLIVSALSVLVLATSIAFGQSTSGTIEGTVKDSKGGVVPGATVTVNGVSVGFNQTVTTNGEGSYRIDRVPAGRYKVTVAPISGFAETVTDTQVVIEKTTIADVTLGISTAINVDVNSDPLGVILDSTDSKVQTNITAELIDKLPTGTSFGSILKLSPGTRGESLTGGYQVDGASKAENSFILDGQEVTSYRHGTLDSLNNIPTALVKEVQVKNSGFEAEHGGASGGVISVVTKSGTDQFNGEFGAQFNASKLQPNNRFTTAIYRSTASADGIFYAIQQPKDKSLQFDPTASLGGPIIKQHLWFYGIYSPQVFSAQRSVNYYRSFTAANGTALIPNTAQPTGETYTYNEKYEYAQGRLDYSFSNNLNGFTSYLWNPRIIQGSFPASAISVGGTSPTQVGYSQTGPSLAALKGGRENSNIFTTQMSWAPKSWFALTGRFGHGFINSKPGSYAPVVNSPVAAFATPRIYCLNGLGLTGAAFTALTGCAVSGYQTPYSTAATLAEISKRDTFNVDASFFFSGLGRHTLKGGYENAKLANEIVANPNVLMVNYYGYWPSDIGAHISEACFIAGTCIGTGYMQAYGEGGKATNRAQALYIQDKWQIKRLTLNLGLRAESENLPSFTTAGTTATPIVMPWGRKMVPRLGAAFDLFGNGKTRIFGSYGIFSDRMKFELPIGSFGGAKYNLDYYPITAAAPHHTVYSPANIWGGWTNAAAWVGPVGASPIGGGNPSLFGGLAQLELDYRIPSNLPAAQYAALVGFPIVGVDPKLKPFKQDEMTVGFETELSRRYVINARFTRKNLLSTLEDIGYIDNGLNEYYTIGNPGEGVALTQRQAMGITKHTKAKRLYKAFEIGLTRRFADNYFFSANYTRSSLTGNTSGLANSDYWDGGAADGSVADRASPGVNRFFDWPLHGFNALGQPDDGPLATDRPNVFKAYGGYSFDWWGSRTHMTDVSFFTTAMSGTPQTTVVNFGVPVVWTTRGDMGRTETFTQTDFSFSHGYKFGRDNKFRLVGDLTLTNAFNENNITALDPRRWKTNGIYEDNFVPEYASGIAYDTPGFAYATQFMNAVLSGAAAPFITAQDSAANRNKGYGMASAYQGKRNIRFGFRLIF